MSRSFINPSVGGGLKQSVCVCTCMCVCVCVCVCVLPRNLGECFVSLLVEPISGKNVSFSDKRLWWFLKNILVAEKSQCKALLINCILKFLCFCWCQQKNTKTLTFVSLKLCFLGSVHCHNELFFSYLWSFVLKFTSSSTNLSWWGRIAHTLFNYNRVRLGLF